MNRKNKSFKTSFIGWGFVFSAFLMATQSWAVFREGWERPILKASLEVTHATFEFKTSNNLELVLTKRDGAHSEFATGLKLTYDDQKTGESFTQFFQVTNVAKDECGSTVYSASAVLLKDPQARFNLTLTDNSTSNCKIVKDFRWEITARKGYGFCGTMDSTLEAVGNPEGVLTIQMGGFNNNGAF